MLFEKSHCDEDAPSRVMHGGPPRLWVRVWEHRPADLGQIAGFRLNGSAPPLIITHLYAGDFARESQSRLTTNTGSNVAARCILA